MDADKTITAVTERKKKMQMFILDENPRKAAEYLCDAHVRVIGREVTMLLATWYYYNSTNYKNAVDADQNNVYKPMSVNQPLVKAMDSVAVRRWALYFAGSVFKEFKFRFGKEHDSFKKFNRICWEYIIELIDDENSVVARTNNSDESFTFVEKGGKIYPGLTMEQAITMYRDYYKNKLKEMKVPVVYTGREIPEWLKGSFSAIKENV